MREDLAKKQGIKPSGDGRSYISPIFSHSKGTYYEKGDQRIIEEVTPEIIKGNVDKRRVDSTFMLSSETGHMYNRHSQSVFESFQKINKATGPLNVASIDIESLGLDYMSDKFAITEVGISGWQLDPETMMMTQVVGKEGIGMDPVTKEATIVANRNALSLVGYVDKSKLEELEKTIDEIKKGTKRFDTMSQSEKIELKNLLKYSNANAIFDQKLVQIGEAKDFIRMNMYQAAEGAKLPLDIFNPKIGGYTQQLEEAVKNLRKFSNDPGEIIKVLQATALNPSNAVMGHNLAQFDMNAMAAYFDRHAGGNTLSNSFMNFFEGKGNRFVLDTLAIYDYAFPNPSEDMRKFIPKRFQGAWGINKVGQLSNDVISSMMGVEYTHGGLQDSITTANMFNRFNKKMRELKKTAIGGEKLYFNEENSKGRGKNKQGKVQLLSIAGINPQEIGEFDRIYDKDADGKFVLRTGLNRQIYKNDKYEIDGLKKVGADVYGHKYGSYVLTLKNTDKDFWHTVVRPETAAGTGIDEIRAFVNNSFIGYNNNIQASRRGYFEEDKAMASHRKLYGYKPGQYEKTRKVFDAVNGMKSTDTPASMVDLVIEQGTLNKVNDPALIRDLKVGLIDRLRMEAPMMDQVFAAFDAANLSPEAKDMALSSFHNFMEGTEKLPGINVPSSIAEKAAISSNLILNLDKGMLMLGDGSSKGIRTSLNNLAKDRDNPGSSRKLLNLIQEMGKKGFLTQSEVDVYTNLVSKGSGAGNVSVIRSMSVAISNRTKKAIEMGDTVENAIKVASDKVNKLREAPGKTGVALRAAEKDLAEKMIIGSIHRDTRTYMVSSLAKGYGEAWDALDKTHQTKILETAIEMGRNRSLSTGTLSFIAPNWMQDMFDTHNKSVRYQFRDFFEKGIENKIAVRNLKMGDMVETRIRDLVEKLTSNRNNSVMFVKNPQDNMLNMFVFNANKQKEFAGLSSKQLFERTDTVMYNFPLANEKGLLRSGGQVKVNQPAFRNSGGSPVISATTGIDRIIDRYSSKESIEKVNKALQSGDPLAVIKERNRVQAVYGHGWDDLSGVSASEIADNRVSKSISGSNDVMMAYRQSYVDISGIVELLGGKPWDKMNSVEKMEWRFNSGDLLYEHLEAQRAGLQKDYFNLGGAKEKASEGLILVMDDPRGKRPFGYYNPSTSQIVPQSMGMQVVDSSTFLDEKGLVSEAVRLEKTMPKLVTQKEIDFYKENGLNRGGMNLKTLHIMPHDFSEAMADKGLSGATLHDGTLIMAEHTKKHLDVTKKYTWVLDELNEGIKERWLASESGEITIPGIKKPGDRITIGQTVKDGIVKNEIWWDKKQDLTISSITENDRGQYVVEASRVNKADVGLKLTDYANKGTVGTFMETKSIEDVFGVKGIEVIQDNIIVKKGFYGEMFNRQTALLMQHAETVGGLETENIKAKAVEHLNKFFGLEGAADDKVFRLHEAVAGGRKQTSLVVPENLNLQRFKYQDYISGAYAPIGEDIRTLGTNKNYNWEQELFPKITLKSGRTIQGMVGIATGGVSDIDHWQKAVGVKGQGIVNIDPKFLESLQVQDLDETTKFYKGLIKGINTSNGAFDKIHKSGRVIKSGLSTQYMHVYENMVTGRVDSDDIWIRSNEIKNNLNDVSLQNLRGVPTKDFTDPLTNERYTGTVHDFERFAKEAVAVPDTPGALTSRKAHKIYSKGSFMLDLGEDFTIQGRRTSSIRIISGDPVSKGHVPSLEPAIKEGGKLVGAVKEWKENQDPALAPELRKKVVTGLTYYDKAIQKGVTSSQGYIYHHTMSARVGSSGNFQMAAYELSRTEMTGVVGVSENYFDDLFKGHKDFDLLKDRASMANLSSSEGVYALTARAPYTSAKSAVPVRLVIDTNIKNDRIGMMSAVDAIRAAGDFDGDTASLLVGHYNKGGKAAEAELRKAWIADQKIRSNIADILIADAKNDAVSNGESKFTIGKLSNLVVTDYRQIEKASSIARIMRSDIGEASNLNTYMRRVAIGVHQRIKKIDPTGELFSSADKNAVSNLGELIEQSPVSGKQSNFREIYDSIAKEKGLDIKFDRDVELNKDVFKLADERLKGRITVGGELRKALLEGDRATFMDLADKQGLWRLDDELKANQKRQRFSPDDMWKSWEKLRSTMTSRDADLKKLFTKSGGNLTDMWGVITGQYDSSVSSVVDSFHEMIAIPNMRAENDAKQIRNAEANLQKIINNSKSAFEELTIGDVAREEVIRAEGGSFRGAGKVAMVGAAIFGGLAIAGGMMRGNGLSDKVDHNLAIGEAGYAQQIPMANPPGPQARVVMNGAGQEGINVSIKARDMAGMSQGEIGSMIQSEISGMMPMDVNFNITKKDNSQKLDSLWVQNVISNSISKGYAF